MLRILWLRPLHTEGEWFQKVTYQELKVTLRTDESFRAQLQEEHHKGYTPFCDLPINMITAFPLDYIHQACLGVMKRLVLIWVEGEKRT